MFDLMSFLIIYLQAVLSCKPECMAYEKKKKYSFRAKADYAIFISFCYVSLNKT